MTDTPRPQTSGATITTDSPSSQVVTQHLGHLAFCALVALHLARQEGTINSPYAENMFLTRWLSLAQKQKRFPKTVAQDIVWLLEKGRLKGTTANLKQHVEYLYRSCTGVIEDQTELFRLTYAIETLKERGWRNILLTARELQRGEVISFSANVSALYTEKSALSRSFNSEGTLCQPLPLLLTGNVDDAVTTFQSYNLSVHCSAVSGDICRIEIIPQT
ncbi:DUF2913 family protein [Yersinia intermedia]|uniref:DUF2913 family protein n=1 Tax=Yersinia intermedia TaxID=631 RepID=UPI0022FEE595|nr:DUF2913 family protein [Yersinia intermedia]MDA5483132.1 DUF2913 family protein [Yersinia intermedia]